MYMSHTTLEVQNAGARFESAVVRGVDAVPHRRRDRRPPAGRVMARANGPLTDAEAEVPTSCFRANCHCDQAGARTAESPGKGGVPVSQPAAALRMVQGGDQQFFRPRTMTKPDDRDRDAVEQETEHTIRGTVDGNVVTVNVLGPESQVLDDDDDRVGSGIVAERIREKIGDLEDELEDEKLIADGGTPATAVGHCYYCGGELPEGASIRVQVNHDDPQREICTDCFKDWPPEGVDTSPDDEPDAMTARELEHAANNTPVDRAKALAIAANLVDGHITEEEAGESFHVLKRDEERWGKEYYPGDDAFDRADFKYGGIY